MALKVIMLTGVTAGVIPLQYHPLVLVIVIIIAIPATISSFHYWHDYFIPTDDY